MVKKDDLLERAFEVLEQDVKPTEHQKEMMFNHILVECKAENVSGIGRLKRLVVFNPWKFAFTMSAVQAVVLTIIFGTQYTNLFLSFIGG